MCMDHTAAHKGLLSVLLLYTQQRVIDARICICQINSHLAQFSTMSLCH